MHGKAAALQAESCYAAQKCLLCPRTRQSASAAVNEWRPVAINAVVNLKRYLRRFCNVGITSVQLHLFSCLTCLLQIEGSSDSGQRRALTLLQQTCCGSTAPWQFIPFPLYDSPCLYGI